LRANTTTVVEEDVRDTTEITHTVTVDGVMEAGPDTRIITTEGDIFDIALDILPEDVLSATSSTIPIIAVGKRVNSDMIVASTATSDPTAE
jgi:hypothetical protein